MLRVKFEGGISTIALLERIREVINKRIQEKKKNEFTDLAPIDDIENGAEYLKALHWAIKKEKVKNIALAGPYGAGKSSIIDTYLKKHRITRRKALRVSMATFVENKTDKNGNPKKISLEQDEIELGILKQLFYKVNYKKIPQSRYRKLHKINWKRVWGYLVLIFFVFGIVEFIFFPDTFQMIIKKIEVAGGKFGLKGMVSNSIFLAFCVGILAIIARTYRLVLFRFKVNEVKLPAETVLKNSETAAETVFNKNMDEIVYFFEETKYRIVFFEDLDRLEDPSIFIHLRELNILLNNYDGIKGRIVFVYAIRDDIFTDTDRTKFFEFIIPVIPIINSTNSGEIFLQKLEESEKKGIVHEISQEFILDVSPYVEDMRILQNIYNEFIVYKETIRTDQELKLSDETMMALIIFKNLYPREFAELQMERGVVKQAFEDKQRYISEQCMQWRNEIDELTQKLEKYHDDCLEQVKELKTAMLGAMVDWQGIPYSIKKNYWDKYSVSKIMEDSFELLQLAELKDVEIEYYTSITYERKIFYLQLLIDNVDTKRLFELNDNNNMSGFIEENPDILQQLSSIQDQKVISLIEILGIIFTNVSIENVSEEVLRYVFENQYYELNDTMIRRIVEFENDTMLSGLDTRNYTTIISLGYEPLIKYIQENLKQYVKGIILTPNNTKEDVKQVMDLLERMLENDPEETKICLELVNHEEICVDDISECCGKFDSDFDKDVKILWDELLDKEKVSLKWENIKCYWDRYKITQELLQYIETNSEQLACLKNQCLKKEFAEEFITSAIDDSAFEKLLPQLELEFDIPIETVEKQKVEILIKKKYIPFDIKKYDEIKEVYPDLCPDFILYNQAEYMEVMEKIPMGETLLETLLLSSVLDSSNAEVLLNVFGENYMTTHIAQYLLQIDVKISISVFNTAWTYLLTDEIKNKLMLKYCFILNAPDFEECFSELSKIYPKFGDRSKRHNAEMANTNENKKLVDRLKEVGYITSYTEQEKDDFDPVKGTGGKKNIISCWIKMVKM